MNPRKRQKSPIITIDLSQSAPIELPNQLYDEMRAAGLPIPPPIEFLETPRPAEGHEPPSAAGIVPPPEPH
ncbi:MAG: hypothetical protein LC104_10135 [Bacteroidales bacterium]|nr:hypothetical protein [Bacteroidales bacterium]